MKWFGHLENMGNERQVKRVAQAEIQGRRPAEGSRTRWKDVLRRNIEGSEWSLEDPATKALGHDRWKRIVEASCNYKAVGSQVK